MRPTLVNKPRTLSWRSPWGTLPVLLFSGRIRAIGLDPRAEFAKVQGPPSRRSVGPIRTTSDLSHLMRRVLAGQATAKEILAASELSDCTEFERKVLVALAKVRRGEVISYGELAEEIGAPRAARAVGSALGKNPIPILLPCHRVVASNGIGGYGGSAERGWRPAGQDPITFKRALLAREGVQVR